MQCSGSIFNESRIVYEFCEDPVSAGLRGEGVPFRDVFGQNNGRRRPGYYLSFEPRVIYKIKNTSIYMYLSITAARKIKQDITDARASGIKGE